MITELTKGLKMTRANMICIDLLYDCDKNITNEKIYIYLRYIVEWRRARGRVMEGRGSGWYSKKESIRKRHVVEKRLTSTASKH